MKIKVANSEIDVDLQFCDLVGSDDDFSLTPHTSDLSARSKEVDPVQDFVQKSQFDEALAKRTTVSDNFLNALIPAPADVRDTEPAEPSSPSVSLEKRAADRVETEKNGAGQVWKYHYAGAQLVKIELFDSDGSLLTFDELGELAG